MKKIIYEWLYKLSLTNGLNERVSVSFARNYVDDKIALNMIKKQFVNKKLKNKFENICIRSFKLQKKIKFKEDTKLINFKSTYCCKNIYNGNKKRCNLCNQLLKF